MSNHKYITSLQVNHTRSVTRIVLFLLVLLVSVMGIYNARQGCLLIHVQLKSVDIMNVKILDLITSAR